MKSLKDEPINNTMKRLLEIQKALKAPKNQKNTYGKYSYRSCEDILEAVKPLLSEGDHLSVSDDIVEICGRIYLKATVKFKCEDGIETATAFAREPESQKGMTESQITGTASSYARKYALNALFLIDDQKDDDTKPPPEEKTQDMRPWLSEKQYNQALVRIENGEFELLDNLIAKFKMKKTYLENLKNLSHGNSTKND